MLDASKTLAWNQEGCDAVIDKLATLSFLEVTKDYRGEMIYSMHPLIHEFLRDWLPKDHSEKKDMERLASGLVDHTIPEEDHLHLPQEFHGDNLRHIQLCVPIVQSTIQSNEFKSNPQDKLLRIGYRFGCVLSSQGRYSDSLVMLQLVYDVMKDVFGENHPDTLLAANSIAAVHYYNDSYHDDTSADKCEKLLLAACQQAQPNTAILYEAQRCLAMLYDKNGRYRTAVDLCERARMGFEDLLGFEHPYTLLSIACHSTMLVQLVGQAEDAMILANKALQGYMKIRSFSSFSTMMAATIVAVVALYLERYKDADDLIEKVIGCCAKTQNTLTYACLKAKQMGALSKIAQGQHDEGLALAAEALKGCEVVYGSDNVMTYIAALIQVTALLAMNRLEEAEAQLKPSMTGIIKYTGEHSYHTLQAKVLLSCMYLRKGDLVAAVARLKEVMCGCERLYGQGVNSLLAKSTYPILLTAYEATGDTAEAESLKQQYGTLLSAKILGQDIPIVGVSEPVI